MFQFTQRQLLAATLVLGGVLPGTAGAASDILDQSQPSFGYITRAFGGAPAGQIFTAGTYGILDRVSVELENYAPNPLTDAVVVSIQTVRDGLPSGDQIAIGMIPVSAMPTAGTPGWVDVSMSGAVVIAGTQYALVLYATGPGECLWYYAADVYPRGSTVYSDQGVWYRSPSLDATFKTYVIPDMLDQAQTSQNRQNLIGSGWVGQIFTPGRYGLSNRVSVELENHAPAPATADIAVGIYEVSGGYPSGTPISSGMIPLSAIPPAGSPAWVDAAIHPVILTPGIQYALVLSLNDSGYVWWKDTSDGGSYPNGHEVTTFASMYSHDTAFRTYVVPDTLDQGSNVGSDWDWVAGWQELARLFTPGVTGTITRVSVHLSSGGFCGSTQPDLVEVSIRTLNGGYPSTTIGSGIIPVNAVPVDNTYGWVDAAIIGGAVVTRGTPYALVLATRGCVIWLSGGGGQTLRNEGAGWYYPSWPQLSTYPMSFRTYVVPFVRSDMAGSGPGTLLSASQNPSIVGQEVTYTATVSPVPDGGTVLFRNNGTAITGCTAQAVDAVSGEATCPVIHSSVGTYTIIAEYSGHGAVEQSMAVLMQDVQYALGLRYKVRDQRKAGSTIPIKLALLNAAGQNLSSAAIQIQALCVVAPPIPSTDACAGAPSGFDWTTGIPSYFKYEWEPGPGGGYHFNVKTVGLPAGTYHLILRATGESGSAYHVDAGVTFNLSR